MTTTASAKSWFTERRALLQSWLPQPLVSSVDDFARLLDIVETSYIHLETIELWMMDEPDKFQPHLETCLRAFELPARGVAFDELLRTSEWIEVLDQAGIDAKDVANGIKPHMLTGYEWMRPVPWH